MNVNIEKCHLKGTISAPPSKSYTHRYLIAAMLSLKKCTIKNVFFSEDVQATLNCLKGFGCQYTIDNNQITLNTSLPAQEDYLFDCHESGSTLRFLIPIALTKFNHVTFTGTKRLIDRGIEIYEKILPQHGITLTKKENCFSFSGKLQPGHYEIPGNISSQFISGLLFALPLLNKDSTIKIISPIYSTFYIHMTLNVLKKFKIAYELVGTTIKIFGNQKYHACSCKVDGDYSNAAFLEAFNFFDHQIKIKNLNPLNIQGDRVYQFYFKILKENNAILDISNAIDLGPILFVMASLMHGATFTGTKRLTIKESNRAQAMADELQKIGVKVSVFQNKVKIYPNKIHKPYLAFESHNDHRIVMALSILSTFFDISIHHAEAINKSYPNYFDDLTKLGAKINYENE